MQKLKQNKNSAFFPHRVFKNHRSTALGNSGHLITLLRTIQTTVTSLNWKGIFWKILGGSQRARELYLEGHSAKSKALLRLGWLQLGLNALSVGHRCCPPADRAWEWAQEHLLLLSHLAMSWRVAKNDHTFLSSPVAIHAPLPWSFVSWLTLVSANGQVLLFFWVLVRGWSQLLSRLLKSITRLWAMVGRLLSPAPGLLLNSCCCCCLHRSFVPGLISLCPLCLPLQFAFYQPFLSRGQKRKLHCRECVWRGRVLRALCSKFMRRL